jgi:hypothetical protein
VEGAERECAARRAQNVGQKSVRKSAQNRPPFRAISRLALEAATWKGEELRMSFREPFSQLRLSNRETQTKDSSLHAETHNFEIWRRGRDSNPGSP